MTPLLAAPAAVLALGPSWMEPQHLITAFGGWALLGVALVVFAETGLLLGFFLPGDTLLFTSGLLVATGALGTPIWLVVLGIAVAATAGGMSGYLIGRRAGPVLLERTSLVSDAQLARTHAFFERRGSATIVVARFAPVVRTLAPVVAGAARMPVRRYALGNAVGAVLWSGVLVLGGYFLGQIPAVRSFALQYLDLVIVGVVVLSVAITTVHLLRERHARRSAGGGGRGGSGTSGSGTSGTGSSGTSSRGTAGTTGAAGTTGTADAVGADAAGAGPGGSASRPGPDPATMARTAPPATRTARPAAGPRHRTSEETP